MRLGTAFLPLDNHLSKALYNPSRFFLFFAYTPPYFLPNPHHPTWIVSTNPVASLSQSSSRTLLLKLSLVRLNIVQRVFPSLAVSSTYATIYPSPLRSTPRHAPASPPHPRLRRNSPRTSHPIRLTPHPLTFQTTHYIQSGRFPRARVMLL